MPTALAVGFTVGLLLALAPSCGPATCTPANCDGCCDEAHMCHPGNEATYCGVHANACVSCGTNACEQGACFPRVPRLLADGGIGGGFEGPWDGGTIDDGGTMDDAGTVDGGRGYTIDDFCDSALSAVCAYYVRCGRAQARVSCEDFFARTAWQRVCGVDEKAAVKDGRATFDPVRAQACRVALRNTVSCAVPPAPCTGVFTGNAGVGDPCFDGVDCAPGAWCDSTAAVCPGTCKLLKPAGVSAASGEECQTGLYLYLGKCAAFAAPGTSCAPPTGVSGPDQRCTTGSFCNSAQRCQALGGIGAVCADSAECHVNLQCVNRACRPYVAAGQPCGATAGDCRFDLRCPPATTVAPSCAPLGDAGVLCANTFDCSSPFFCERPDGGPGLGRCAPVGAAGAPCRVDLECGPNLFCDPASGLCAQVAQLGQSCMRVGCAPGLACVSGQCAFADCHDPTP